MVNVVVLRTDIHLASTRTLLVSLDDRSVLAVVDCGEEAAVRCHVEVVPTILRAVV